MPNQPSFTLPQSQAQWDTAAIRVDLRHKSLRSCRNLLSGSRVSPEQFLLFRAICPAVSPRISLNFATYGFEQNIPVARHMLAQSHDFSNYIANVGTTNLVGLGRYTVTLMTQSLVTRDLFRPSSAGETTVNTSLLDLLNAITSTIPGTTLVWNPERQSLTANFGRVKNDPTPRKYTAETDGELEDTVSRRIRAIIECKKSARLSNTPQVQMQEVAQMVAWIKEHPDDITNDMNYRLTVSQDREEIYISFFEYSRNWVNYLRGGRIDLAGLATLKTYGPWCINNGAQMSHLAEIILAICLLIICQHWPCN